MPNPLITSIKSGATFGATSRRFRAQGNGPGSNYKSSSLLTVSSEAVHGEPFWRRRRSLANAASRFAAAIEDTVRGLLKVYGLKIGAVHRNRFAARVSSCSKWPHSGNVGRHRAAVAGEGSNAR